MVTGILLQLQINQAVIVPIVSTLQKSVYLILWNSLYQERFFTMNHFYKSCLGLLLCGFLMIFSSTVEAKPNQPSDADITAALNQVLGNSSKPVTWQLFEGIDDEHAELFEFSAPKEWENGFTEKQSRQIIYEFVPKGQTVNQWNELATIQALRASTLSKKEDASSYMVKYLSGLEKTATELNGVFKSTIVSSSPTESVATWKISNTTTQDQEEIVRTIRGVVKGNLYMIHYVSKTPYLHNDETKQHWLDWVKTPNLKPLTKPST